MFLRPKGGWSPAKPNKDGLLSHTWIYPSVGAYQDSGLTTPAVPDGDPVGEYDNQGTDAYNLVQAVTAAKPTLKLNILNGHPVFRGDGGDWLSGTFSGGALSHPITIFIVAQIAAASVDDGTTFFYHDGIVAGSRAALYKQGAAGADTDRMYGGATLTNGNSNGNWNIFTELFNGASSLLYKNGVSVASGNAGTNTLTGLSLFSQYNSTAWFIGDVAECLIYSANLSNAAKNQMGQYFNAKYGIPYTDII